MINQFFLAKHFRNVSLSKEKYIYTYWPVIFLCIAGLHPQSPRYFAWQPQILTVLLPQSHDCSFYCRNSLTYARTTSRTFPTCDVSVGSQTLPMPEAGDFVELILLYGLQIFVQPNRDKFWTSLSRTKGSVQNRHLVLFESVTRKENSVFCHLKCRNQNFTCWKFEETRLPSLRIFVLQIWTKYRLV